MSFVLAFLVGGLMCALFQVVMMITKLDPPEMLVIGFALGGVLVPTGVITWLEAVGGGGMSIMVLDAGGATFAGFMEILRGNPLPLILVVLLFAVLTAIGCVTGAVHDSLAGKKGDRTLQD